MTPNYAVIQMLNFEGCGEWVELSVVYIGTNVRACKEVMLKLAQDFRHMYEVDYEEQGVTIEYLKRFNVVEKGWAVQVTCISNPTLWAEFYIAEVALI